MHEEPQLPRTVKPRKPTKGNRLSIIVYTNNLIYRERDDTYHKPSLLPELVKTEPSSIFVAVDTSRLLCRLDQLFRDDSSWQFKVRPIERTRNAQTSGKAVFSYSGVNVDWFGFTGLRLPDGPRGGKRHEPNRYHRVLDPATFCGVMPTIVSDALADTTGDIELLTDALYLWARSLRGWCEEQGVTLRSTNGSIAAQLLKDPRFYPEDRRKVPSFINESVRSHLPGNYYKLFCQLETEHDAFYLDQVSAHHTIAQTISLPNANNLFAYGHHKSLIDKPGVPNTVLKRVLAMHGSIYCKIHVPHLPPNSFPPPWASKHGRHLAYLFTNELQLAYDLGIKVEYVIAAWVSPDKDTGLAKYAEFSKQQLLKASPLQKDWLKSTLLATYGILAAKPRKFKSGFAKARDGEETCYAAGAGLLSVIEKSSQRESEPSVANVMHRAMIEAETRKRSLEMARMMVKYHGFRVLSIYADSVFLDARDKEGFIIALPLLPPEWRLQAELSHLRFHTPVSFTSDRLMKMPGTPKTRPAFPGATDVFSHHARRSVEPGDSGDPRIRVAQKVARTSPADMIHF
jgi:hypothetical protein